MPSFTVPALGLRNLLAGASVAVGTDRALPILNRVHLEWSPGSLVAAATDRYRLSVGTLTGDLFVSEQSGSALIDRDDVASLVKALPRRRAPHSAPETVEVTASDVALTFTGNGWTRVVAKSADEFVKYRAIMWPPEETEPVDRIGFNGAYLASAAKVPTSLGIPWAWRFKGALKPAIGTCYLEGQDSRVDWQFLVMPVRLTTGEH